MPTPRKGIPVPKREATQSVGPDPRRPVSGPPDPSGRVRVAVRVRPLNAGERAKGGPVPAVGCADPKTLTLACPSAGGVSQVKRYTFDMCAHAEFTQEDVFEQCGTPALLEAARGGMHVTILAYGATGSGKTHTILGEDPAAGGGDAGAGLIERSARYLFAQPSVRVVTSFYEVYSEQVFDLLDAGKSPLPVRHNVKEGFFVPGLVELECLTAEDVSAVVEEGRTSRRKAAHKLNRDSSRGHAVLTVRVVDADRGLAGKINFVDLAGNERLGRSRNENAAETGSINRSLFCLGKVISTLAASHEKKLNGDDGKNRDYVPYRDSTLTKLLMDSLGGDVFTLMIACVSPSSAHVDETLCTLQYASRAKGIHNTPTVRMVSNNNTGLSNNNTPRGQDQSALRAEVIALRREVARLRDENAKLRAENQSSGFAGAGDRGRDGVNARSDDDEAFAADDDPDDLLTIDDRYEDPTPPRRVVQPPDSAGSRGSSYRGGNRSAVVRRAGSGAGLDRPTPRPPVDDSPRQPYEQLDSKIQRLQEHFSTLEAQVQATNANNQQWQQAQLLDLQLASRQQAQQQHALIQQQIQHQLAPQDAGSGCGGQGGALLPGQLPGGDYLYAKQHAAYFGDDDPDFLPQLPPQGAHSREDSAPNQRRRRVTQENPAGGPGSYHVRAVHRQQSGDVVRRHREGIGL